MHAQTTTQERTRQTRCARVGIWQFCELCLGLTKRYRPDKVWHAVKQHFTRNDTTMREELDLPRYLSRTNAPFLVGDMRNYMTGCNTLASLHLQPGSHTEQEKDASFTYVSHSIKEFFDNVQKVPEKFINASAYHLCMDPQVQWVRLGEHAATVHDHPDLFKAQHTSGPDALAREYFANYTRFSVRERMYLGEPFTVGVATCTETRFDWEQDKQLHNLSKVDGSTGTNITKQWLKFNNRNNITKLSMACTQSDEHASVLRPLPDDKDADDASVALFSHYLPMQVLFALLAASLIVSCV